MNDQQQAQNIEAVRIDPKRHPAANAPHIEYLARLGHARRCAVDRHVPTWERLTETERAGHRESAAAILDVSAHAVEATGIERDGAWAVRSVAEWARTDHAAAVLERHEGATGTVGAGSDLDRAEAIARKLLDDAEAELAKDEPYRSFGGLKAWLDVTERIAVLRRQDLSGRIGELARQRDAALETVERYKAAKRFEKLYGRSDPDAPSEVEQ
jgi:hypothetical protein